MGAASRVLVLVQSKGSGRREGGEVGREEKREVGGGREGRRKEGRKREKRKRRGGGRRELPLGLVMLGQLRLTVMACMPLAS